MIPAFDLDPAELRADLIRARQWYAESAALRGTPHVPDALLDEILAAHLRTQAACFRLLRMLEADSDSTR